MATMRLPILSGLEICKALSKNGFYEVSRKGSHIKMKKRLDSGKILSNCTGSQGSSNRNAESCYKSGGFE